MLELPNDWKHKTEAERINWYSRARESFIANDDINGAMDLSYQILNTWYSQMTLQKTQEELQVVMKELHPCIMVRDPNTVTYRLLEREKARLEQEIERLLEI